MEHNKLETLPISRDEFARLEIFNNIQFEKLAGFLLNCKAIEVKPGTTLIEKDKENDKLFILLEGALEVSISSKNGHFINKITPGHCAGEMSIFENSPPSGNVSVKERSKLLIIPSQVALSMLKASHELCLNFLQILSQRLRSNNLIVCEGQSHIHRAEESARIDPLTGLHNRRWMEEMYTREINRCNIGRLGLTALMLDIDHFKSVNDTYGHLAGDHVLIHIAKALLSSLRPTDMPVRFGGEEFCVLLPCTNRDGAKAIAERIRKNVEDSTVYLVDGHKINVTVSIGLAERIARDTASSLFGRADKALYYAKEKGRNCVVLNMGNNKMQLL